MEPHKLKVVGVNKTTVTVMWEWQRKSGPISANRHRVNRYGVKLRSDSEEQSRRFFLNMSVHQFLG